jgi:hypothetical protein
MGKYSLAKPRARAWSGPVDPIDPGANGDSTKSRVMSGDPPDGT